MLKLIKKGELSAVTYGEVGGRGGSRSRSHICSRADCGCGCGGRSASPGRQITIRHDYSYSCVCHCHCHRHCHRHCNRHCNREYEDERYAASPSAMDSDQRRAQQHRPCAVIGPDRHPHPHSHSHPHSHAEMNPRPPPLAPPPPHYPSPSPYSEPHEPHKSHFEPPDPAYQLSHREVAYNVEYPDYQRFQAAAAPAIHNPAERVPYEYPTVAYPRIPTARYEPYPQIKDKYIHSRYEYQYPYNQYPPQTYADLRKRVKTQSNDPQFYQVPHPQTFYPTTKVQTNVPCNIVDISNQKYHAYHARQKQYIQTAPSYDTNPKVVQDQNKIKLDYYNRYRAPAPYPNIHYPNENYHIANYGVPNFNYGIRSPNVHYPNVYYHKPVEYRPMDKSYESEMASQKYYNPKYVTNNPLARIPTEFSPNVISPAESTASFESVRPGSYQLLQEDGGYVSQCSTLSRQSAEYQPSAQNEYYNQSCSRPCQRANSFETLSPKIIVKQQQPADKPALDLRQFLEMWDEEYEDPKLPNTDVTNVEQGNPFVQQPVNATKYVPEQLYVLDKTIISEDELKKYEHLQKVTKLPDFIKDVETNFSNGTVQKDVKHQHPIKTPIKYDKTKSQNLSMNQNKPIMRAPEPELFNNELIDVESKISQSVIHKEVRCNFEIKPCSPSKLVSRAIPPEENQQNCVNNKNVPHGNSNYKNDHKQYPAQTINYENNATREAYNVPNKIERNKNVPPEVSNTSLPVIHSDEVLIGAPLSYRNQTIHYSAPSTVTMAYREPNFNYSSASTHGKVNVIMNPSYVPHKNSQKEKNDPQQSTSHTTNYAQVFYDNSYMNEYKNKNVDNSFTHQKHENYEYYSKISKVNNANFPKCSLSVEKSNESFYAVNENPLLRNGDHWMPKSNEKTSNLHYGSVRSDLTEKLPSLNDVTIPMINPGDIKKIDVNTTNCRTVICRNKSNINNRDNNHSELDLQHLPSNFNNTSQRLNEEHSHKVFNNYKPETENLKRSVETFTNDVHLMNTTGRHMHFDSIHHNNTHEVTPSILNDSTVSSISVLNLNRPTEMISNITTEILNNESKSSIIVNPVSPNIEDKKLKENTIPYPKSLNALVCNEESKTNDNSDINSSVSCEQNETESNFPEIEPKAEKSCELSIIDVAHSKNNSVIVKSCENTHSDDTKINDAIKPNNLNEFVENYLEEVSTELPNLVENDDDLIHAVDLKLYSNSTERLIEAKDDFAKPISNSDIQFNHSSTDNPSTSESNMSIDSILDENNTTSATPDISNDSKKDVNEVVTKNTNDGDKIIHNECENQTNNKDSEIVHLDKTELPHSLMSTETPDSLSTDDCGLNEDMNAAVPQVESVNASPEQCITTGASEVNVSTENINGVNAENINEDVVTIEIEECLDESIVFDKFETKVNLAQSNKVDFENESKSVDDLSVSENQDVIKDDDLGEGDDCDEMAFKSDNCNILKSASMDEQETYISFEGDKVNYFSADFDYDSRYVIIRTDEHLSYAAADSSENDFTCDEHASDMTLEESHLSPGEIREKLNSEDGNGLEIGGCWIDDIACVETVVAEETIQDSTDCYKSPEEFWNVHPNDETTNSPISYEQDSDSDVLKDSNSNVITNYKEQIIVNSNDSTKCSTDSSYKVQTKLSSRDSSSTRTSEESTEQIYKNHYKLNRYKSYSSDRKEYVKKDYSRKRSSSDSNSTYIRKKCSPTNNELDEFINNEIKTKGIPSTNSSDTDLKCQLPLPENKLLTLGKLIPKKESDATKNNRIKNRMVIPKKPCKPKFEDVLRNIDKVSMSQMKMKFKKIKSGEKEIPKVIIKRNEQGSHYTSSSKKTNDKSVVKNKWQPQVCLRRNNSIEKMVKHK
ncbi:uncharacterized protein LOC143911881 [Arctopsyche grandis]|uniref:uncharacterized protein LOC143911881 n=1 Tax=Arctopsyche grandis TaxID=121162 RepID=UPI00406D6D47